MTANGIGVAKNDTIACKWFQRAASKGHAQSQNNLGWMLANGRGVPKDYQKASEFFRLAALQENGKALALVSSMPPVFNQADSLLRLQCSFLDAQSSTYFAETCRAFNRVFSFVMNRDKGFSNRVKKAKTETAFLMDLVLNIDDDKMKSILEIITKNPEFMLFKTCGSVKYVNTKRHNALFPRLKISNLSPLQAAASVGHIHLVMRFKEALKTLTNRQKYEAGLQLLEIISKPDFLSAFFDKKNGNSEYHYRYHALLEAQTLLMFENDQGVSKEKKITCDWYHRIAEQGNASAQYNLGWMYQNGRGVPKDAKKAVEWYLRAAAAENTSAQFQLSVAFEQGQGVNKDEKEAFAWYLRAAEQGHRVAQFNLGVCFEYGRVVTKDENAAYRWYLRSAQQGFSMAQCNLAWMLFNGRGVARNDATGFAWLQRAAEQGLAEAQCNLGFRFFSGRGVTQDDTKACEWFKRAAEQGFPEAQFHFAWMLINGLGVAKDEKAAIEWFLRAAEQGFSDAQNTLGWFFANGRSVLKDYKKACEYFQLAAEKENQLAQINLGIMYELGLGVENNKDTAHEWYRRASLQNTLSDESIVENFVRCIKEGDALGTLALILMSNRNIIPAKIALEKLSIKQLSISHAGLSIQSNNESTLSSSSIAASFPTLFRSI